MCRRTASVEKVPNMFNGYRGVAPYLEPGLLCFAAKEIVLADCRVAFRVVFEFEPWLRKVLEDGQLDEHDTGAYGLTFKRLISGRLNAGIQLFGYRDKRKPAEVRIDADDVFVAVKQGIKELRNKVHVPIHKEDMRSARFFFWPYQGCWGFLHSSK